MSFRKSALTHSTGSTRRLPEQTVALARSVCPASAGAPAVDKKDLTTVTHTLVNYCNTLYMGLPLNTTQKLQLLQNVASQMLMGAARYQHLTLLMELHWLLVGYRAHFKVLINTYKVLHGLRPGYLKDL